MTTVASERYLDSYARNRLKYGIIRRKASVESWRGIILASVVILVILGLIAISIFIVTPKKYLRKYNSISLDAIVQLTQGAISDGLIWSDDVNYYWFYTSEGLWKIFPVGDVTSATQTHIRSIFLFNFSSRKDLYVSGVSLSPDKSTWLIEYDVEHGSTNGGGKSYEAVVLGQSNNFDVERFDITFLLDERQAFASRIRWANQGTEMVAAIEGDLYFSKRLSTNTHNFGFVCLTCNLTDSYAYGQIYPHYLATYDYDITDVYWMSPVSPTKIILLAFQKDLAVEGKMAQDIGKLSDVRKIGLVVLDTQHSPGTADLSSAPFATENLTVMWMNELLSSKSSQDSSIYVAKAAWFDHQTFLLMCTSGDRRYLWILLCRLSHGEDPQKLCQRIWHFRSMNGILRKPQNYDLRRSGQGSVYAILPHSGGSYTQYRLANLQISPSRLQWISPRDYDVQTLEFISDEVIIFTSEYKVEGSRHLLRFDRRLETVSCLTCTSPPQLPPSPWQPSAQSNSSHVSQVRVQNSSNLYQRIAWASVSPDGNRFAVLWRTGYDNFRPLRLLQLPVTELRNQLTGQVTQLGSESETASEDKRRLSLIPTCKWDQDLQTQLMNALAVFRITILGEQEVRTSLLWTRYELPQSGGSLNIVRANFTSPSERPLVRVKRGLDVQKDLEFDHEEIADPPSAKQPQSRDSHDYLRYDRRLRLFDQPPLGFPFLLPVRGALTENGHWVPFSVLRCITLDSTESPGALDAHGQSEVPTAAALGALVRFWYPPMLNERYITKYSLLLIVQKFRPLREQKPHALLQDLAFELASEQEVVVARVEDWMGTAREVIISGDPLEEMKLYKSLLKTMVRNYHYIDVDRISLIGYAGEDSHLATLLMSSQETPNIPRCGVLIAPIFNFQTTGETASERYLDSYAGNHLKYGFAHLVQNLRNLRGKSVLIVHEFADPLYPFSHSVKLIEHLLQEGVDYEMLLHPYGTTGVLSAAKRTSFLRHVSNFLVFEDTEKSIAESAFQPVFSSHERL
nr:unnamed protein product [Spirometra erinaceieuropaei]